MKPISPSMLMLVRLPVFRRNRFENFRFPVLLGRRYAESSDTLYCRFCGLAEPDIDTDAKRCSSRLRA